MGSRAAVGPGTGARKARIMADVGCGSGMREGRGGLSPQPSTEVVDNSVENLPHNHAKCGPGALKVRMLNFCAAIYSIKSMSCTKVKL
jgi:hypothetical protein